MSLRIQHASTRHNLNRLRDHIFSSHAELHQISLLINCGNGEINIPQPLEDLESSIHTPKIHEIRYRHAQLSISSSLSFSLRLSDSGPSLEKRAIEVIQETLALLNQVANSHPCRSAKDVLLELFRSVTMELPLDLSGQPGWMGSLDREGAEKLLEKAVLGTYLLREGDDFTRKIEYALSKYCATTPRCYLFTLKEDKEKISDKVLIQKEKGWAIYNDDFEISDYSFQDLSVTIAKAGGIRPLKLRKAA